jgi:hypothetical protein
VPRGVGKENAAGRDGGSTTRCSSRPPDDDRVTSCVSRHSEPEPPRRFSRVKLQPTPDAHMRGFTLTRLTQIAGKLFGQPGSGRGCLQPGVYLVDNGANLISGIVANREVSECGF